MKFILTLVIALAVGQLAYAGPYGSESKYGFYLDNKTNKIFP